MRPVVWECDGCELRSEEGMPGCPPAGWVMAELRLVDGGYEPLRVDLCPTCARGHDLVELMHQLGREWKVAKPKKEKPAEAGEQEELL